MAVRALVATNAECYHVLGLVHAKWTHLHDRIKDYVSGPKSNAYQSLHTTIFGPGGHLYEIQIRTREMHRTAEYGIAAHWTYKDGVEPDELDEKFSWLQQLLDEHMGRRARPCYAEFALLQLANPRSGNEREFDSPLEIRFEVNHAAIAMQPSGRKALQCIHSFVGAMAERTDHVPAQVEDSLERGVQEQVERRPPICTPFVCQSVGSDAGEIEVVALLYESCQTLAQTPVVAQLA